MARGVSLTFEEGCNKYLENCRQRNLREGIAAMTFICALTQVNPEDVTFIPEGVNHEDKITITECVANALNEPFKITK